MAIAPTVTCAQTSVDKAAEINGKAILASEVDAKAGRELAELQEQLFDLRRTQLEALIDEELVEAEAVRRGVTTAALLESEITSQVTPVTDDEAAKFLEENKAKLKGDAKTLLAQIKNFLHAQRSELKQQEYLKSLRASAKIEVFLTPPPFVRVDVKTAGAPARGPASAPVTIVEFSDFHCPFCRKVQPVLDQLRAKYGDKIRIVYRELPLDELHPEARVVSEAAGCANDQGKFWEFHDAVFRSNPDASATALDSFAREAGMDLAAFAACRTSAKHKGAVLASNEEGTKLGISGTPTFFVNGRVLVGAQPLETFIRMIDQELALIESPQTSQRRQ
jgi:protein-disulfide isomerase